MTELLHAPPWFPRDDDTLLEELNELTEAQRSGCPEFRRVWPLAGGAASIADVPWLHASAFKHLDLITAAPGVVHGRSLLSSATSGQTSSRIHLDSMSSELQARSSLLILVDFLGDRRRPLIVLDSASSVRRGKDVSARLAAAMALGPLAEDLRFVLAIDDDPDSVRWDIVNSTAAESDEILVYGFTWMLWLAWGKAGPPPQIAAVLQTRRVHFVHSGGWKKLDQVKVTRGQFESALLAGVGEGSSVLDYYGLVEQVGLIYPLCPAGSRHVPRWADVVIRDPWTQRFLDSGTGQLQLLNVLAHGSPCHSVLTEDLGRILPGDCSCGRRGKRFEFVGRIPKAELRGCAVV